MSLISVSMSNLTFLLQDDLQVQSIPLFPPCTRFQAMGTELDPESLLGSLDQEGNGTAHLEPCSSSTEQLSTNTFDILSLKRVIGEGLFGRVWEATIGNYVIAAKEIKEESVDMVEQEIRFLKRLHHPNLVSYLGTVSFQGRSFMCMQKCDGGTVRTLTRSWNLKEKWTAALQLCNALVYLHNLKKPIVHADVKPDNIFVFWHGSLMCLKLGDFGLSTSLSCASTATSGSNLVCVPFAAPEVLSARIYSRESDIWSYGMTLYELFSLVSPYLCEFGSKIQVGDLKAQIIKGRLPEENSIVPVEAWRLMQRCWRQRRKERLSALSITRVIRSVLPNVDVLEVAVVQSNIACTEAGYVEWQDVCHSFEESRQ